MENHSLPTDKPLVVDLDGTLLRTDLLVESANHVVVNAPFRVWRLPLWLCAGRATLKARLAEACALDPATLPYNRPLLELLRREKARGRRLVLATASHHLLAERVAEHLALFDEVLATAGGTNLKGAAKRDALLERFGAGGFDYVGNERADLPIWAAAGEAWLVDPSPALLTRVRRLGKAPRVLDADRAATGPALLKALRPHQWTKNLLLFIPLLAAHRYADPEALRQALLAFLAFSLAASGVYLLNDLVDVAADRHHPAKRLRPFAAGRLGLQWGWLAWPALLTAAFLLAGWGLPPAFGGALALYVTTALAYSLRLKQSAVLDVLTLAGLYTLRIIAGAVAISVPLSFWLLSFSMFIFLSLAFMKRYSELKAGADDRPASDKLRGRGYHYADLEMVTSFGTGSGYLAVLVLALYIQDSHAADLYATPQVIWLACPLLLYWISRTWLIAHRGEMHDDPVVFALKDVRSWLVAAGFLAVFVLAKVVS